jgi:hypothetical protein
MRPFYWIILIVVQLWFTLGVTFVPFNAFKVSYRREERAAALKADSENPSPATRAAVLEELHRATRHTIDREWTRAGVLFAVLVALDILFLYGWKHCKREPTSA